MKLFDFWSKAAFAAAILFAATCVAQQKTPVYGEYEAISGPMKITLHMTSGANGSLTGTVDSPSSNLYGAPLSDIHINGQSLSFNVPVVRGSWIGFIDSTGDRLSGTWSQGTPIPLSFNRPGSTPSIPQTSALQPSSAPTENIPAKASQPPKISFSGSGTVVVVDNGKTVEYTYDGTIKLQNGLGGAVDLHYTGNSAGERSRETAKSVLVGALSLGTRKNDVNFGNSWEFKSKDVVFYRLSTTTVDTVFNHNRYNALAQEAVKNAQAAIDFAQAQGKPLTAIATGLPILVKFSTQ